MLNKGNKAYAFVDMLWHLHSVVLVCVQFIVCNVAFFVYAAQTILPLNRCLTSILLEM